MTYVLLAAIHKFNWDRRQPTTTTTTINARKKIQVAALISFHPFVYFLFEFFPFLFCGGSKRMSGAESSRATTNLERLLPYSISYILFFPQLLRISPVLLLFNFFSQHTVFFRCRLFSITSSSVRSLIFTFYRYYYFHFVCHSYCTVCSVCVCRRKDKSDDDTVTKENLHLHHAIMRSVLNRVSCTCSEVRGSRCVCI